MFEISVSASLQRVLTDVHVKSIGVGQSHWLKERFKIDSGTCGSLMPLGMYKLLYIVKNHQPVTLITLYTFLITTNKKSSS